MVVILAPFGVAVGLLLFLSVARLKSFLREHKPHKVLFWLGTGHHADGQHRNNRTWRRSATRSRHPWHMGWLARRSRLQRMGMVWGGLLTVTYTMIGWFTVRTLTVVLLWLGFVAVSLAAVLSVVRCLLRRQHRRTVVHPIAAKLAGHMKQSPVAVARNLRIRPRLDGLSPGDTAAILGGFPDEYTASMSEQAFVEDIFTMFLPVQLGFVWDTSRYPMRMRAICAASPPKEVTVRDWQPLMDRLGYGQYFLGAGAGDEPLIWDSNEEDPHACVNSLTRGGKTNLNLAIAAQGLRRGEGVDGVDPKRRSLECLIGVPGFRLANDPGDVQAMWDLIRDFRLRMDAEIAGYGDGKPRKLILEECNQLHDLFRDHWLPRKGPGELLTNPPPVQDIKAVLHQGGQFGYTVLADGQDLKANILFGARSQFGCVLMGNFKPPQWRYVAQTTPIPNPPTRRGRFALVRGGSHTWVQVVCADPRKGHGADNEAGWREFALGGTPAETPAAAAGGWRYWAGRVPQLALPAVPPWPRQRPVINPVLIGNVEGAAYLGMTRKAFQVARGRQPVPGEFTTQRGGRTLPCWSRETLDAWVASRPSKRVA
jgi:hypothetical protein